MGSIVYKWPWHKQIKFKVHVFDKITCNKLCKGIKLVGIWYALITCDINYGKYIYTFHLHIYLYKLIYIRSVQIIIRKWSWKGKCHWSLN